MDDKMKMVWDYVSLHLLALVLYHLYVTCKPALHSSYQIQQPYSLIHKCSESYV